MVLCRISICLAFCLFVCSAAPIKTVYNKWSAVKCLVDSNHCSEYTATRSGACVSKRSAVQQPDDCKRLACEFCKWDSRTDHALCRQRIVQSICTNFYDENTLLSPQSPPTLEPEYTPISAGSNHGEDPAKHSPNNTQNHEGPVTEQCTWKDDSESSVVIDIGRREEKAGWTRISRDGLDGLVYRKDKKNGIDFPDRFGSLCFEVKTEAAGSYYFTALSFAPHYTEHNDAWFKCSKGFSLWRNGRFWKNSKSGEWLKGFQNDGRKRMSEELKTKDHDGHRFIIENLNAGDTFSVCVSGRSYKFELYRLYIQKCRKEYCTGEKMTGLRTLQPSKCS